MISRPLRSADIPILEEIAARSGFPYPDLRNSVAVKVITDDDGKIIMAAAVNLYPEAFLYVEPARPLIAANAMQLLHVGLSESLRKLGYTECNVELPPQIAARFGRRLQRSFGWMRNTWDHWFIRF